MDVSKVSNEKSDAATAARLSASYGKLPISFEINQGQTDRSVQFLARGAGYTLFLTPGEAVLSLHATSAKARTPGAPDGLHAMPSSAAPSPSTVRLQLIGASTAAQAKGVDPLPGKSNYFIGNDPAKWHTDVPTYAKVRYTNVYPGIDLLYYGNQEGRLEHDFVVAPGADPNAIAIGLRDSNGAVPDRLGGLTVHTKNGDLTLQSPTVYQDINGQRKTIPATYLLTNNQIKFQLAAYDITAPLIIDPVLKYSALFGGHAYDAAYAIAVDSSGSAYVTGGNNADGFPATPPASSEGAYVSKINASGTALLYSTYIAGTVSWGSGIAVDSAGRAYVVGITQDATVPVKNAYQPIFGGGTHNAFLTVLAPAGNDLVYSTYFGAESSGQGIALDASGNAYITGSGLVPALHSVLPPAENGWFVAKFNKVGALQYSSTFSTVGGPPNAIAVDASGSAYITGTAHRPAPQITRSTFQSQCAALMDEGCGFVTKLSTTGESIAYSTYFGHPSSGGLGIFVAGIAVDSSGNAYIAGSTGPQFSVTQNAFQKTYGGNRDGFVLKLNATGTGLIASTYLGGSDRDLINNLAIDQYRQVYVTGNTNSPNFPLKASLHANSGTGSMFVTTLSDSLGSIVYYSTYFGVSPYGPAITVDKALNVYLTGSANGAVPPTTGALHTGTQGNPGGDYDVFISKLVIMDDLALGISGSSSSVVHGSNLTYTIAVTSKGPDFGYNVRIDDPLPAGTTFVADNAGGGTCTAPAIGATGTLHCSLPKLEKGGTYTVTLTVKVNAVPGTTLSNTATTVSNMQDFVAGNNKGTLSTKVN